MYELKEKAIKAAARFLIQRGYEVVETGWKSEGGSAIDVVAREDDAVVFVDVYARLGADRGMPEDGGEASRERREIVNLPQFRLHPYAAFRRRSSSGRLARSNSSGLRYPSAEWVLTLL